MEFSSFAFHSRVARRALIFFFAVVCILFLAAPLLAHGGYSLCAEIFYSVFSTICHQIPERSFTWLGQPWAVCQRCSGIYFGLWLGAFFYPALPEILRARLTRKSWLLTAVGLLALDAALPLTGFWTSTAWTRVATGMVFGAPLSLLLVPGLSELWHGIASKRIPARCSNTEGGAL